MDRGCVGLESRGGKEPQGRGRGYRGIDTQRATEVWVKSNETR